MPIKMFSKLENIDIDKYEDYKIGCILWGIKI